MSVERRAKEEWTRLKALAQKAYYNKDFKAEKKYDDLADPLYKIFTSRCAKCNESERQENLDNKGLCYQCSDKSIHPSHHYDSEITDNNQRCSGCAVKQYHHRAHWPCGTDVSGATPAPW